MRDWLGLMLVLGMIVSGCGDDTTTSTVDMAMSRDMATGDGGAGLTATIMVMNDQFVPTSVTIRTGGTVTWTWGSGTTHGHTVTSGTVSGSTLMPDGKFCNGTTTPSVSICTSTTTNPTMTTGSYSFTFNTAQTSSPGAYPFYCRPHAVALNMKGTVTVVP